MAAHRLRGGRLRGGKGGNPKPIGGEGKVQLIMFTYLFIMLASENNRFLARLIREN